MELRDFVGLVVDPLRLVLLGRAVEGTVDVTDVAQVLGVPAKTVRTALGRLRASGLVDDSMRLDRQRLREIAVGLPQTPPPDPDLVGESWSEDEAVVLARFFSGRRLTSIPAVQGKRRIVLERLVQEFDPGVRYLEAEVNFRLQLFHADYAALRRALVDEGLMTRADGVYWRTGGRYDPAGES